jgi:hypothetical protein
MQQPAVGYNRRTAVCLVDGEDLNAWQVREGLALAYRKYSHVPAPDHPMILRHAGTTMSQSLAVRARAAARFSKRHLQVRVLLAQIAREKSLVPNYSRAQREFAQHFNGFPKMTFASSSPLSPASQCRLGWPSPGLENWDDIPGR